MTKRLIIPKMNVAMGILLGAFLSEAPTVTGLENDTTYVAYTLSAESNEFTPTSQYTNAQARAWASKLSTPLSDAVAVAYDQLFIDIGDIITAKADSFGICATETQEAAIKNLVQNAPDLSLINPEVISWQQWHGFAQVDFGTTTYIDYLKVKAGGTGYTYANVTITAPSGAGPVQATATAVIEDGSIVGLNLTNKGAGYVYTATGGIPTVTITGDGSGALAIAVLYMGRINTGIIPNTPGLKLSQNNVSLGIGSTQYNGTRGACLGGGSGVAQGTSARVSLGTTINTWVGGTVFGSSDFGVYSLQNTGHYFFTRTLSTTTDRFFNGSKLSAASGNSGPPASEPLFLFNRRENDSWKNLSRHSWFWIGAALTELEHLRVYYAINRFLSTIGVEAAATRTVQGTLSASSSLSSGSTITYTIDPSATPGVASFDIEPIGNMPDASFSNTFVASVAAACAASSGKYTFDGVKKITIVSGTTTPLSWTRTSSSTPATGYTHGFKISNGLGALFNQSSYLLMQGSPAVPVIPTIRGVNLSGMEFSTGTSTTAGIVPQPAHVDVYASRGFNVIRLPFSWRRVQHEMFGPLDIVGNGTGDAEKIKALVDYITITKGMYCILDPHDSAARAGVKIGTVDVPVAAYEDYWIKLINYIGISNPKVIINLTNEPGGIPAMSWMRMANSLTAAIRSTGSLQHIQVPGNSATGAHDWISSGNGAAMLNYVDPANNYCFEVHQYLDSDHSGTKLTCVVNAGSTRMNAFYDWLETNNKKGFVGEVMGPCFDDPTVCPTELNAILAGINSNPRMYGWAAWGGGANWGTYYNRIEDPATGVDSVVMNLLVSKLSA